MNKFYKKAAVSILIILGLGAVFLLSFYKETGKISYKGLGDGYEITIYDKWNKMIKTQYSPVEPIITKLNDNISEVVISVGSPARYAFYFDHKEIKISEIFFNPILVENKYIAYFSDNNLVIMDLFNEGLLYKTMQRDFTETANPSSSIINIELIDEEFLAIEYYVGEDYKETEEIISIDEDKKYNKNTK